MKRLSIFAASLALVVGLSSNIAQATTLVDQPYDTTGNNYYASQNDPGSYRLFSTAYDNFNLAAASTVTGVGFTGVFFNPGGAAGDITGFNVNFYADSAGSPGSALTGGGYTAGNAGQSCDDNFVCTYSLTTNFAAAAGTTYWLSIVPTMIFPPQWAWTGGTGGDGNAHQLFFGTDITIGNDLAFTLTGTAAGSPALPEPGAWAMMLLGLGVVGGAMRRKRGTQDISVTYA